MDPPGWRLRGVTVSPRGNGGTETNGGQRVNGDVSADWRRAAFGGHGCTTGTTQAALDQVRFVFAPVVHPASPRSGPRRQSPRSSPLARCSVCKRDAREAALRDLRALRGLERNPITYRGENIVRIRSMSLTERPGVT